MKTGLRSVCAQYHLPRAQEVFSEIFQKKAQEGANELGTAGLEATAVDLVSPPTSMPVLRNGELGVSKVLDSDLYLCAQLQREERKGEKEEMDGRKDGTITTLRITSELFPLLNT